MPPPSHPQPGRPTTTTTTSTTSGTTTTTTTTTTGTPARAPAAAVGGPGGPRHLAAPPPAQPSSIRDPSYNAAASQQYLHPQSSQQLRHEQPRGLSPVPSARSTLAPATPSAVPDSGVDYFDTLSLARNQSVRSHTSNRSGGRPRAGTGPRVERDLPRQPSIRIRRRYSNSSIASTAASRPNSEVLNDGAAQYYEGPGRPRSVSQPEQAHLSSQDAGPYGRNPRRVQELALPRLTEEGARPTLEELGVSAHSQTTPLSPSISMPERGPLDDADAEEQQHPRPQRFRRFWPGSRRRNATPEPVDAQQQADAEYDEALVDWLDTIDPEVQTLSTLTNVQNSLFIPDLGSWINRRPTYNLSQHQTDHAEQAIPRPPPAQDRYQAQALSRPPTVDSRLPTVDETGAPSTFGDDDLDAAPPPMQRTTTITSRLTDSHYAALPHGQSLEGWTADEKWELDDHVRHMLHSRRARMKRRLKGFGQYVRRPLGFAVTLYATLITLFGLAWVLFLIGWIYVGDKQVYVIHIIDSVLVALFAIMGDGLAPFRAVDTYRLIHIVRYTRIIENAKKGKLPRPRSRLQKKNVPPEVRESMDLAAAGRLEQTRGPGFPAMLHPDGTTSREDFPDLNARGSLHDPYPSTMMPPPPPPIDLEDAKSEVTNPDDDDEDWALSVLTPKQQKKFAHHKKKLASSHSFYKPHETFTHYAFDLKYLIAIVVLLDCHSCLQISLGATTWGIDYRTRPFAITTVILCVSITCNITAGIVISRGDKKARKKDVMQLLNRQELTGDAIKEIEKKKRKEEGGGGNGSSDADEEGVLVGGAGGSGPPWRRSEDGGFGRGGLDEVDEEKAAEGEKEKEKGKLRKRTDSPESEESSGSGSGGGVKKLVKRTL